MEIREEINLLKVRLKELNKLIILSFMQLGTIIMINTAYYYLYQKFLIIKLLIVLISFIMYLYLHCSKLKRKLKALEFDLRYEEELNIKE